MNIKEALLSLDTLDDAVWTTGGEPKLDVVSGLVGEKVTRQQIVDVAPLFSQTNPEIETEEAAPEIETEEAAPEVEAEEQVPLEIDLSPVEAILDDEKADIPTFQEVLAKIGTPLLETLHEGFREQLSGIAQARAELDSLEHSVRTKLIFVKSRIAREVPQQTNQDAIREYLESQAALRDRKKQISTQLLEGLDVKSLDPRAPIDRAMARKSGRGGKRPTA